MQSIKDFEPLWGEWRSIEMIGQGSFGKVYKMVKQELDKKYYSAVKHLSFPIDSEEEERFYADGLVTTQEAMKAYYEDVLKDIRSEIDLGFKLRGFTNIVSYEDFCIYPKSTGLGYDIFIKMELLTDLSTYIKESKITVRDVVKLGEDICKALTILQHERIIHQDIKPGNIFINSDGDYKLGDFGSSEIMERMTDRMSVKGTFSYMAPEVAKGHGGSYLADLYSLGLVLYRLLNRNRGPFLPSPPQHVTHEMNMLAQEQRLRGDDLPPPSEADEELAKIILKACAYRTEDRWSSAEEMGKALEEYKITKSLSSQQSKLFRLDLPSELEYTKPLKSGTASKSSPVYNYMTGVQIMQEDQVCTSDIEGKSDIIRKNIVQTKIRKLFNNLVKWGVQTVLLSLLPMFFYILVHWMLQIEENPERRYLSELCSFTFVISSSIAIELSSKKLDFHFARAIISPVYFILQTFFCVIYGTIYCCLELNYPLTPIIISNMFLIIEFISGIYFVIALLIQILEVFYGK